jgi:TrmH family RNA methyltransferase
VFCVCDYFVPRKREESGFVLLLDGVADPGNFGAVLRSADAFGVDRIYTGAGCADRYNPKTVRACMGSLFRVEICGSATLAETIATLRSEGFRIYATALDERSQDIRNVDLTGKVGFVIGNEGHGVSLASLNACTGSVIIPMREGPESLNAAVASGVVMWEAARSRLK